MARVIAITNQKHNIYTPHNKGVTKFKSHPCLCGCGEMVVVHKYPKKDGRGYGYLVNSFIRGHGKRGVDGYDKEIHSPRICACGCGNITNKNGGRFYRFLKGHENVGRVPWNKGRHLSESSRAKMSLAKRGIEPKNKVKVDLSVLYNLYVDKKLNISEVSRLINVSEDVIKNRLRKFGWSRTTKESCSLPRFKNKMRHIRVKVLSSNPVVESPNKLEKLVYDELSNRKIYYEKQVPLFDKFVVDVLFPRKKVVLEIFGKYWHNNPKIKKKDFSKKKYLEKCGYRVEELWDYQIKSLGVVSAIGNVLNKYNLV